MNGAALHLTERVLPKVPIRQFVCSLPWQLRTLLGYDRVLVHVVHAELGQRAEQQVLASCYQAASAGLELMGERAGQPSLRLMHPGAARVTARSPALCAEVRGVNVHATAAIDGRDRPRLLRLCRYIARPALAQERFEQLPESRLRLCCA
jgi:hypothetical protein